MQKKLAAILVLCLAFVSGPVAAQDRPVMIVTGSAQVSVAPDLATVILGAETQSRQAVEALRKNSTAMGELFNLLQESGIEQKDMQTSGLSLEPQYLHSSGALPKLTGYVARNRVTVRLRDLDKLGALLDAAVSTGSNVFHGLSFGLQDPVAAQDIALAKAVARARAKAEIMAGAAGVELGPLLSISESGSRGQPVPIMREAVMAMDAVPVAEGSVSINATANLTFEILQNE